MGRSARGVTAIKLKKAGDEVVGMVVLSENDPEILTVCQNGYGKRTSVDDYRLQSRGGSGVINCKVSDRNGPVTGACAVNKDDQVMIVTDRGMMIRMRVKQISLQGRGSQGGRRITVDKKKGEEVASVARTGERDEEEED